MQRFFVMNRDKIEIQWGVDNFFVLHWECLEAWRHLVKRSILRSYNEYDTVGRFSSKLYVYEIPKICDSLAITSWILSLVNCYISIPDLIIYTVSYRKLY